MTFIDFAKLYNLYNYKILEPSNRITSEFTNAGTCNLANLSSTQLCIASLDSIDRE